MSRILMTWELGAHYGHLGRQLPVAQALRAAGHELLFAVRNTATAAELLAPHGFAFVQAPVSTARSRLAWPPASYAELLLAENYADAASLAGRIQVWLSLFALFRPEVIVADHSPTALVAARTASIPVVQVGTGFEVPPSVSPLPTIRPWQVLDEQRLRHSEQRVVRAINACLKRHSPPRLLATLAELFDTKARILTTFPELDHYDRDAADSVYAGALFTDIGTGACEWKRERRPRIFAYLHNGLPGLRSLIEALASAQADTVCVVSGATRSAARRHSSATLRMLHEPVGLSSLLAQADLVACQASMSVTARSLLASRPLLLVPATVEQYLLARRVERLGAGRLVGEHRTTRHFADAVRALLETRAFYDAAARFADRHARHRPQAAIEAVVQAVTGGVSRVAAAWMH